ncbi:MAG: hypothetical protein PVI75_00855 [Gammaproteobacteria bacterium]
MSDINLREQIIIKSIRDPEFNKQLQENPKKAILSLAKAELDKNELERIQNMNFNIIHEKRNEMTIVLPYIPDEQQAKIQKLSDDELAVIAGANTIITCGICSTITQTCNC